MYSLANLMEYFLKEKIFAEFWVGQQHHLYDEQ